MATNSFFLLPLSALNKKKAETRYGIRPPDFWSTRVFDYFLKALMPVLGALVC